jgi:hypothetical protein
MQEDVTGPLHTIGKDYEPCGLCGQVYPTDMLKPYEGEPSSGVRSERDDLCPECRQALSRGEQPGFPPGDDQPSAEKY